MSKDQAKKLKAQVNDSKRNICDLKAKVSDFSFVFNEDSRYNF
jgi:hypothetical protein